MPVPTPIHLMRTQAQRRLPRFLFDYLDGGAGGEQTLVSNQMAFDVPTLRQRVLRNVARVDTATTLLGADVAMPIVLAPVGMAGMYARRGEAQAARAASAAGVPFTLSTVSICDLAEVKRAADGQVWFQLYVTRDRSFMEDALLRAERLGVDVLVLTVDMPVPGIRYRDRRSGLSGTPGFRQKAGLYAQAMARPGWCLDVGVLGRPHRFGTVAASAEGDFSIDGFWAWMADNFDATVTWSDFARVRDRWKGRLLVKGVLDPEDAVRAVGIGADGVVVSNHGGRQLDGAAASLTRTPAVRRAIGPGPTLLMDGGVRSGGDVTKALALGASGVMIGRPWVYALAAEGGAGVTRLLADLHKELAVAMALTGVTDIASIDGSCLETIPW